MHGNSLRFDDNFQHHSLGEIADVEERPAVIPLRVEFNSLYFL
jgi:hypothetical protein